MASQMICSPRIVTSVLSGFAIAAQLVGVAGQSRPLALTRVNVVNVADGRITRDAMVVIEAGTIVSVARAGDPPPGAEVVDGQGGFLIPGLWDMHTHIEMTGSSSLQLDLANGVTGIRDMGSELNLILGMREVTAAGRMLGPRIFAAGPILDDAPGDWPFRMRVRTAAEGEAAVRLLKGRGVDLIKVHDHTPSEAFFAIAREARRQGLKVAGHVPLGLTVEQVVDAGQTDIEHLSNLGLWIPCSGGDEYKPEQCRGFFRTLAQRNIWQTPTLAFWSEVAVIGTPAWKGDPDQLSYVTQQLKDQWAQTQSAFVTPNVFRQLNTRSAMAGRVVADMETSGVSILAGCDGLIPGFCLHDELAAMVRGGLSTRAALQTATINPVRYFGLEASSGSITPGKRADVVLLAANPLSDITNTRRIRAVVLGGRLLRREDLDDLLLKARLAAR